MISNLSLSMQPIPPQPELPGPGHDVFTPEPVMPDPGPGIDIPPLAPPPSPGEAPPLTA